MRRLLLVPALVALLGVVAAPAGAVHGGGTSPELDVIGQLDLAVAPGHITDVWAHGAHAYLGSYFLPECSLDHTGVHVIDISDPAAPTKVAFIESPPGSRANDVKVEHLQTRHFQGELLVHTNEPCADFHPRTQSMGRAFIPGQTGVALYDVTNPAKPRLMKQNFLDFPIHNTFLYQQGERAFMIVVDDVNDRDVHIVDITKPSAPREVAATGQPDWPDLEVIPDGDAFLHDVWVQETAGRFIAYLSYWDGGLVLLDVTDPANPAFLGDSTYQDPDPLSTERPEGNSHVAVPTADGELVFMGDEDFSPFGLETTFQGDLIPAAEAAFTKPIADLSDGTLQGPVQWTGGTGCEESDVPAAKSSDHIALIQRGDCLFLTKGENAQAKGYQAFVVANDAARGDALVTMIAPGDETVDIPGLFVGHSTGETMKPVSPNGVLVARAFFDGWGYGRILDVTDPADIVELGQFATENVLEEPPPDGDRTMHNVIVRDRRAYISWYHEGMRVVDFSGCEAGGGQNSCTPTEVAHFVARPGDGFAGDHSNFWGVYLHDHPDGNTYILGSDRDSGLWIFADPTP